MWDVKELIPKINQVLNQKTADFESNIFKYDD